MKASQAQNISYQTPPQSIIDLVEAPLTPTVSLSPDKRNLLFLARPSLPGIDEVAAEELRIGGLRINPQTNGSSRSAHYIGMSLAAINGDRETPIEGLPDHPKIENVLWAPNGQTVAFTHTNKTGLELWLVDISTAKARRFSNLLINDAVSGLPFVWFSDGKRLLVKQVPTQRGPRPIKPNVPEGPVIQENSQAAAPVRTYQDLLKSPHDEALFEYYTRSSLIMINVSTNTERVLGIEGIVTEISTSPDGQYVMVEQLKKPFSYMVPYYRFAHEISIFHQSGQQIRQVADQPAAENIPIGFNAVPTGPRNFGWRSDKPATLFWVEAQDEGDPKNEVDVRDQLFLLEAPFMDDPVSSIRMSLRYRGITWGDDNLAMVHEFWWSSRREITSAWTPSFPDQSKKVIFDRSYEDHYTDPGDFQTEPNIQGRSVLAKNKQGKLYLTGIGASPEGNRPFVDLFDLSTKKSERLWRSEAPYYEIPLAIINPEKGWVITRRESEKNPPNYFFRNLVTKEITQITHFVNPYEALEGVSKELIKYSREDDVQLTGTLYLPAKFDPATDEPLPVLMWAYPREYKSKNAASQVRNSPYEFLRISYGSPLFWVQQGYAIFDNFAMPIIGEGDEEPNETFVPQLVSGAKAAIDKIVSMGVADRDRIGVGGHSYGAFMTANLLAHSDLFAAGIARSGAYNRTLTPFGFQSEERTYWEVPHIYHTMSPFMHADKIGEPLLLIHGQADNNSGTYPMQSERFYAALKGHGSTCRLVMLPHESHGYRARESILHMLWEMNQWLEKFVKKAVQKEAKMTTP
ncbi:MAG: prolyl oligopeptidase family serine peptidase [Saprospiraceae bacterium]|nr:prolyl oligopeptidase family serine peptidase [Saprospiraceae bacterium]